MGSSGLSTTDYCHPSKDPWTLHRWPGDELKTNGARSSPASVHSGIPQDEVLETTTVFLYPTIARLRKSNPRAVLSLTVQNYRRSLGQPSTDGSLYHTLLLT